MDLLLLLFGTLLLALSIRLAFITSIISLIFYISSSSIVITICYLLMDAPDVAMTEAALGACLSTIILLCSGHVLRNEKLTRHKFSIIHLLGCIALGIVMLYAGLDLPLYGDINTPVHQHISKYFIDNTQAEIGIPSFVAAILASYRGYDTLGETTVIITALLSVFMIINSNNEEFKEQNNDQMLDSIILKKVTFFIIGFIIIFGLYIQLNGEISPGGGFQSGTILASIVIARSFFSTPIDIRYFYYIAIFGLSIYTSVGIISLLDGLTFLDYRVFTNNHHTSQKIGIFIIECGIGISIFASMSALYFLLSSFTKRIK